MALLVLREGVPFNEIYSEGASGGSALRPWLGVRGWGPSPPPTRGQSKASVASLLLTKGLHAITYMCTIAPLTTRILGKIPSWVKYQSALAAICGCILGAARDGARGLDFGRSPNFLFCPFLGFPRAPTMGICPRHAPSFIECPLLCAFPTL